MVLVLQSFTLTQYKKTIESHTCFVPLDCIRIILADELAQMSGLVDQKNLLGGIIKKLAHFFLCVCELRLLWLSVWPGAAMYNTVDIRKIGPKVTLQPPRPPHISDTTHMQTSVFLFFSQSQTDDFCAVRVKNSLHLCLSGS